MTEVYRKAHEVFVWLGPSAQDSDDALDILTKIGPRLRALYEEAMDLAFLRQLLISSPETFTRLGIRPIERGHGQALGRLLGRTWFSRVWVIQEIAYAKTARLLCGNMEMDWDDFCLCTHLLLSAGWVDQILPADLVWRAQHKSLPQYYQIQFLDLVRRLIQEPVLMTLPYPFRSLTRFNPSHSGNFSALANLVAFIAYGCRCFDASDPRDMIYGLLSTYQSLLKHEKTPTCQDRTLLSIIANYSLTKERVYTQFTVALLQDLGSLGFLAAIVNRNEQASGLPSWVPDYSIYPAQSLMVSSNHFKCDMGLEAFAYKLEGDTLELKGLFIDRVTETTPECGLILTSDVFYQMLQICAKIGTPYFNGQDISEVLWRTLLQDTFQGIFPAPIEVGDIFKQWLMLTVTESLSVGLTVDRTVMTNGEDKDPFEVWTDWMTVLSCMRGNAFESLIQVSDTNDFRMTMQHYLEMVSGPVQKLEIRLKGRRFFGTANGAIGLGPASVRHGDTVCAISGVSVPLILRPSPMQAQHRLLGPAYVHGMMRGEVASTRNWNNGLEFVDFTLIQCISFHFWDRLRF